MVCSWHGFLVIAVECQEHDPRTLFVEQDHTLSVFESISLFLTNSCQHENKGCYFEWVGVNLVEMCNLMADCKPVFQLHLAQPSNNGGRKTFTGHLWCLILLFSRWVSLSVVKNRHSKMLATFLLGYAQTHKKCMGFWSVNSCEKFSMADRATCGKINTFLWHSNKRA